MFFFIHLMFMVPKCVLLPNLATPPVGFGQTRPPVLLQLIFYFFCTQENSSPSTSVLKLCPSFPFSPTFHALQLGVRTSSSACSTPLYPPRPPPTPHITLSPLPAWPQPCLKCLAVLLRVFIKCPYSLQRRLSAPPSRLGHFLPSGGQEARTCNAEAPPGRCGGESCGTPGSFFETHF